MDLTLLKNSLLSFLILLGIPYWTCGIPLSKQPRLSVVDWTNYNAFEPQGTGTYAFGYDVEDPETNNIQYRDEERHPNGTVTGSYGYLRPDGTVHIAHYIADENGYRVTIENNPRGQLKPVDISDNTVPQASSISPALASALKSKQIYKKQKVHEQRLRPIDMGPKPRSLPSTSYHTINEDHKFTSYSSEFHDEPSGFDSSFFKSSNFQDPYRFFLNRS